MAKIQPMSFLSLECSTDTVARITNLDINSKSQCKKHGQAGKVYLKLTLCQTLCLFFKKKKKNVQINLYKTL